MNDSDGNGSERKYEEDLRTDGKFTRLTALHASVFLTTEAIKFKNVADEDVAAALITILLLKPQDSNKIIARP